MEKISFSKVMSELGSHNPELWKLFVASLIENIPPCLIPKIIKSKVFIIESVGIIAKDLAKDLGLKTFEADFFSMFFKFQYLNLCSDKKYNKGGDVLVFEVSSFEKVYQSLLKNYDEREVESEKEFLVIKKYCLSIFNLARRLSMTFYNGEISEKPDYVDGLIEIIVKFRIKELQDDPINNTKKDSYIFTMG